MTAILSAIQGFIPHLSPKTLTLAKLEAEEKTAAEPTEAPAAAEETPAATTPTAVIPEGDAIASLGKAAEAVQA